MKHFQHTLALGKAPAREDAVKLKLHAYLSAKVALPTPADPKNFGHQGLIPTNGWGMLGNDNAGDCVWAGAAHETMLANKAATGTAVAFTDKAVLSDYSAVTGYDPRKPSTDQGTDMQVAASYRRKTGVVDAAGKRHLVTAYLAGRKGVVNEHVEAAYLFGFVGIGILFPDYAMDQFNRGEPWDVVQHQPAPQDGHYIPIVGMEDGKFVVVTWGRKQLMTTAFFRKYNDESVVYLTQESLKAGKSPEGFDLAALQTDLAQVTKVA